jgi:hypothetical protein
VVIIRIEINTSTTFNMAVLSDIGLELDRKLTAWKHEKYGIIDGLEADTEDINNQTAWKIDEIVEFERCLPVLESEAEELEAEHQTRVEDLSNNTAILNTMYKTYYPSDLELPIDRILAAHSNTLLWSSDNTHADLDKNITQVLTVQQEVEGSATKLEIQRKLITENKIALEQRREFLIGLTEHLRELQMAFESTRTDLLDEIQRPYGKTTSERNMMQIYRY